MSTLLLPYASASSSATNLASALEIKKLRIKNSRAKFKSPTTVINWGYSGDHLAFNSANVSIINSKQSVEIASDKLLTFQNLDVPIPRYTTDINEARDWNKDVFVRELLRSSEGKGIVHLTPDTFDNYNHSKARLYVEYIKKKHEFRYHVVNNKVIDKRRKALRTDVEIDNVNWKIRNHNGGFIFAIDEEFDYPAEADELAIKTITDLGLDFGAVDIIYNSKRGLFVLEVNTAPGLEGRTLDRYVEAFKEITNKSVVKPVTQSCPVDLHS